MPSKKRSVFSSKNVNQFSLLGGVPLSRSPFHASRHRCRRSLAAPLDDPAWPLREAEVLLLVIRGVIRYRAPDFITTLYRNSRYYRGSDACHISVSGGRVSRPPVTGPASPFGDVSDYCRLQRHLQRYSYAISWHCTVQRWGPMV